jgi:hypothetical protein
MLPIFTVIVLVVMLVIGIGSAAALLHSGDVASAMILLSTVIIGILLIGAAASEAL